MDLNEINILGNIGEDPKYYEKHDMATLSIATNNRWKDKNFEWVEKTTWHSCTAFSPLSKIVMDKLHKGDRVMIKGAMEYSVKENKEGVKVNYATIKIMKIFTLSEQQEAEEKVIIEDDLPF